MQRELNTRLIETTKAGASLMTLSDTKVRHLRLRVTTSGRKTFYWNGRVSGKMINHFLGTFPDMSLVEARSKALEISDARQDGSIEEIVGDVFAETVTATEKTCNWLFELYMEHDGNKHRSAGEKRRIWNHDFKPHIGDILVHAIDHDTIAKLLRNKVTTAPIASNRMQSLICRMFKWAVTSRDITGLTDNPVRDIVKLAPPASKNRYLDDYEIGLFFKALSITSTNSNIGALLCLYLGVRKSEIFDASWKEFNLEKGEWEIPEERTKNGDLLMLPLPSTVIDILKCLKAARKEDDPDCVLLTARRNPVNSFSGDITRLVKTMQELALADGNEITPWTLHDLRRTLASGMSGLRDEKDMSLIQPDIIERVTNHKIGGVRGIYIRHAYYAEKKAALRLWEAHLNAIRDKALTS